MVKSVAIINPYKSGGFSHCYIAKSQGLSVIAIWTSEKVKNTWGHMAPNDIIDSEFVDSEITDYNLFHLSNNILAYISADDSGFWLADKLQSTFFPDKSNSIDEREIRLCKLKYLEFLKSKGIVHTSQSVVTKDSIEQFTTKKIIKPVDGAGNEHVYVVNSRDEALEYITRYEDVQFLIQDFVLGDEYCVELCTLGDVHKCTTIMKYGREYFVNDVSPWRYDNTLISPTDEVVKLLVEYAKTVVSALGIKIGLTWTQIKLTNGVPNLMECNFRSQGHGHLEAVQKSTGSSYAGAAFRAYVAGPESFAKLPDMYRKISNFTKLAINNKKPRYIDAIDYTEIERLESVMAIWPNTLILPGYVGETTGFKNCLAMMVLCNSSDEQYNSDFDYIQKWQNNLEK